MDKEKGTSPFRPMSEIFGMPPADFHKLDVDAKIDQLQKVNESSEGSKAPSKKARKPKRG